MAHKRQTTTTINNRMYNELYFLFPIGFSVYFAYGWGNEDYDRYNRFKNLGYNIYRVDTPLFHLCHPRKENSSFRSKIFHQISSNELYRISNSSKEELQDYIKSFKYE